ncbi:hypothetical protein D5085_15325 [Ectothiorhodospiraceae bacterium BW-2]|nr:hypothetical protein D5085_15325 [Ectothiorhodospiraceae bacterium BW-2]
MALAPQDEAVAARVEQISPLLEPLLEALMAPLIHVGLAEQVELQPLTAVQWQLKPDPATGRSALMGVWYRERQIIGSLAFHAEGQFYVEHDILQPHPTRKQWYIEAVTAWGELPQLIKSELKLIPLP